MHTRTALWVALAGLVAVVVSVSVASAAQGPPPPPKAVNGHAVTVLARGVPTPTTFAFGGGRIFVAGFGDEDNPTATGGRLRAEGREAGEDSRLTGARLRSRLEWRHALCERWSGGRRHRRLERLERQRFAKSRVVVAPRKGVRAFNGIAVGLDGSLYAGISLGDKKGRLPEGLDPVRERRRPVDPDSGKITVVATGLRQPWQPAFVPGHDGPLIADLGQENLGKKRPIDRVVEARQGATSASPHARRSLPLRHYDKPFAVFPAHSSPMGLGALGGKLYVALFSGTGKGPWSFRCPCRGKVRSGSDGFLAPVVALATHGGKMTPGPDR